MTACIAFGSGLISTANVQAQITAKPADAFVESVGVNVHSNYGTYSSRPNTVANLLKQLGVRYIRDAGGNLGTDVWQYQKNLADAAGVKSLLICGYGWSQSAIEQQLTFLGGNSRVWGIENENEPDPAKQTELIAHQSRLWNIGGQYGVKVLTWAYSVPDHYQKVTHTNMESVCNYGALHPYNLYGKLSAYRCGPPSCTYYDSRWNLGYIPGIRGEPGRQGMAPTKPLVATEAGVSSSGGGDAATENVQSKYNLRILLEQYRLGFQKTFLYQLLEYSGTDTESHFGIARTDGTLKPAGNSLKNLLAILKEPGQASCPTTSRSISISCSSASVTPDQDGYTNEVRRLLLQKSNGTYYLILWQDANGFNTSTWKEISVPAVPVNVNFGGKVKDVKTYQPHISATATAVSGAFGSMTFNVPDHPLVIEFSNDSNVYEAENATLSGVVTATGSAGYSGTGYADFQTASGSYIQWTVDAEAAGAATVEFRYALASGSRPLELKVNGQVVNSSLGFPATGDWTTWSTVTAPVSFVAGNNTVRLTSIGSSGANLDSLRILTSPAAPTNLRSSQSSGQVTLNWSPSTGATSYNVKRSTASGGPYTVIGAASTESYVDSTVVGGTTYYYVVSAVNPGGESPNSNQTVSTAGTPDLIVTGVTWTPANPASGDGMIFSATVKNQGSGPTPSGVILGVSFRVDGVNETWSDNSTASLAAGASRTLTANNGRFGVGAWTATAGAHSLVAYVDDVNRLVESDQTNNTWSGSFTVLDPPGTPTAVPGDGQVSLSWPAMPGATGYRVKRGSVSGGPYTTIASPTGTSYVDAAVSNGQFYYYVVSSLNGTVESADSSEAAVALGLPDLVVTSVTSSPAAPLPGDSVVFTATILNQGSVSSPAGTIHGVGFRVDGALVSWSDASTSSLAPGASRTLTANSGPSGSNSWIATGGAHSLVAEVDDVDRISEDRENNNQLVTSVNVFPAAPQGLSAAAGNAQVLLSWAPVASATGYNVKRSTGSAGPFTAIGSAASTSYTDAAAANGTTYYYVISAVNGAGEGANSPAASASPDTTTSASVLEAENATLNGAFVASGYTGFSGTGYADYANPSGDFVEWTVTLSAAAVASLEFRYALPSGDRPLELKVNGAVVNSSMSFPATGSFSTWTTVSCNVALNAGANTVRLTAIGSSGPNIDYLRVVSTGLPSPWETADVGAVGASGNVSYAGGAFTVSASGADIWLTADEFRFVHQPSVGDCSIVARVSSVQNTDPWAKAGVMIRESTAADAINATVLVTPGHGVTFQRRTSTAGSSTSTSLSTVTAPCWVKLTRVGSSFSAYYSADGVAWTQIGASQTMTMSSGARIGLSATSHVDGTVGVSVMDNVTAAP